MNLLKFIVLALCIVGFTFTADAQRRRPTRTTTKPKVVTETTIGKTDLKTGAEKVSIQIKNATKFLYVLGSVATGLEQFDKDVRAGKVKPNDQHKRDILQSIRNLRAGMIALEVDFRTKPQLQKYLTNIQGISDMSGRAEDLANGGEFVESGKLLLLVVEKLADTLAAMP